MPGFFPQRTTPPTAHLSMGLVLLISLGAATASSGQTPAVPRSETPPTSVITPPSPSTPPSPTPVPDPITPVTPPSPSDLLPVAPPAPVGLPGTLPSAPVAPRVTALPRVFAPSQPRNRYTRYPWKLNIVTTVFWIGEKPTANNPTPNHMSSWDMEWAKNFGGYDDPDPGARNDRYHPKGFVPQLNPFYIALPYNDVQSGTYRTKVEAQQIIPWFHRRFKQSGHTVLKGQWVAIRRGNKVCYGQWEDVGPFETDDWRYVFGDTRPRTTGNGGAGLDVSPAIRDFLDFDGGKAICDWRFVDVQEVPDGPWRWFGPQDEFAQLDAERENAAETAERP